MTVVRLLNVYLQEFELLKLNSPFMYGPFQFFLRTGELNLLLSGLEFSQVGLVRTIRNFVFECHPFGFRLDIIGFLCFYTENPRVGQMM